MALWDDWSSGAPPVRRPAPCTPPPAVDAASPDILPPPPSRMPPGLQPQVWSRRSQSVPSDLDLETPPPPPFRAAFPEDDEEVPETPVNLQCTSASNPQAHAVPASARFNAGGGWSGWLAINAPGRSHPSGRPGAGLEAGKQGIHGVGDGQWRVKSHPPRRAALPSKPGAFTAGRSLPPAWLNGRCFRCLYKGRHNHRASECRDPVKCRRCFRSGHRARTCEHPLEPPPSPSTSSPVPSRRPAAAPSTARPPQALARGGAPAAAATATRPLPAPCTAMPRIGDYDRPAEDFVVIHSTPEMQAEAGVLLTNAAYACPEGHMNAAARRLLEILAPASLIPAASPSRPPGFDASPLESTPPFISAGLLVRTPPVPPQRARSSPPMHRAPSTKEAVLAPLAPLFVAAQRPLLSPPPTRPSCRRKTLAGVAITCTTGKEPSYKIKRASNRLKGRRKAAPIAGAAETAVCRGLGIIQDGEVVTELAMQVFADKFKGEVSDNVLAAMRQLFRVGTPEDDAIDDALLGHGGAAGLDLEVEDGEVVTELAMQVFADKFKGEVSDNVLAAMRQLFRVGTPEDDAIDDALLGHGGAAGLDLEVEVGGMETADG
uniref:Uncharacterized protein n=1 Tax=Avena sativa TaxID=4498 RepID=A0ACD5TNK3_AVESA